MRIHHLSCGTLCPHGRRLFAGRGGLLETAEFCCHCLLIESEQGLILVDTGLGTADLTQPARMPLPLRSLMRPVFDPALSALHQVRALGYRAEDVRHILVTHLDFDHAGGLPDFPQAQVHVFADEHAAAMRPRTLQERGRYLRHPWAHGPQWQVHRVDGERWEGFAGVRALSAAETEVLLIPVAGHTRGHCAVAVRDGRRWLLHCGDAYFFRREMDEDPRCPPGLSVFQTAIAHDNRLRLHNQARLRDLQQRAGDRIRLFCAHDPVELKRLQDAA